MAIVEDIGQAYIIYRMIGAAIGCVVFLLMAFVFYRVRLNWKSESTKVTSADCTRTRRVNCTSRSDSTGSSSCRASIVYDCLVSLNGFARQISNTSSVPYKVNQTVRVYYDPTKKDQTATLTSFPHMTVAVICLIVGLLCGGWAVFLWNVRNNTTAQRIGAITGAMDVASRLRAEKSASPMRNE